MTSPHMIVLSADEARAAPFRLGWRDLARGVSLVELWGAMGWFDIRQRYSRSIIGPFWLTFSLAAYTGAIALFFGSLFKTSLMDLLAYVSIGMTIWTFCLAILTEGAAVFVVSEPAIKQMPAPLSVHVYRVIWRNLILVAHNAVVPLLILAWAHPLAAVSGLPAALLGMALVLVNAVGVVLTLGTLGARFRDLVPLLNSVTSLLLFITPIFWRADQLGSRIWLAQINPMYHFLEIVRAPLLGEGFPTLSWAFALLFTVFNLGLGFAVFSRFRTRIPYWI